MLALLVPQVALVNKVQLESQVQLVKLAQLVILEFLVLLDNQVQPVQPDQSDKLVIKAK